MPTPDNALFDVLALLGLLGCGLNGGFFFAFSVVVMRTLAKRPAPEGIAAMQTVIDARLRCRLSRPAVVSLNYPDST